jgi:RNA recognition motif-containing protein
VERERRRQAPGPRAGDNRAPNGTDPTLHTPHNTGTTNVVFIGNLAWGTTEEGLRAFASSVGPVLSVQIQTHADTGRSKGWG